MIWKEKISYSIFCSISYLWFVWFVHLIYYIIFSFVFISFFCSCLLLRLSQSSHAIVSCLFYCVDETMERIQFLKVIVLIVSFICWLTLPQSIPSFFDCMKHFDYLKKSFYLLFVSDFLQLLTSSFQTIGARRLYTVLLTKKSDRWYVAITYIPSIWFTAHLNQKIVHLLFH